jgi:thiamine pyrophosphate-dependent acetolactate synthase large subunit-like protein
MAKETWTIIEPEGLPAAVDRALRVATTPPFGPVHLAVYDKMLENQQVSTEIIHGGARNIKAGNATDQDIEKILDALDKADRPLLYVGDGVWKSGADKLAAELATHFGTLVASPETDLRGISLKHPQHIGMANTAFDSYEPDVIVSLGARHQGAGKKEDIDPLRKTKQILALGSGLEYLKNYPGLEVGIIADETSSISRMLEIAKSDYNAERYSKRREKTLNLVGKQRSKLRDSLMPSYEKGRVRATLLVDAIDTELEKIGGGYITNEQFAARYDAVSPGLSERNNILMKGAGGSEGWGVGAGIGAKLAVGEKPVIGLVGDGSLYYADSGLWTAVHHNVPLLYVIPNNGAYGIVAGFFGQSGGRMSDTGSYEGVVLDGIDPVKIAEAFGMEGERVDDEDKLNKTIERALDIVTGQNRPYLLDVRLPLGLPEGGVADQQYRMK